MIAVRLIVNDSDGIIKRDVPKERERKREKKNRARNLRYNYLRRLVERPNCAVITTKRSLTYACVYVCMYVGVILLRACTRKIPPSPVHDLSEIATDVPIRSTLHFKEPTRKRVKRTKSQAKCRNGREPE
ncbi:hypothetical protein PUN28_008679 [Cardiocondyla obscurior]|uniref:Uncharacterized protein n=1 Tax=Cardiocondyla obscurior TaxID=286306 RepID=A0AAW2G163_9HYME